MGIVTAVFCIEFAGGENVYMKNGVSYRDATIVKETKLSLIVKTPEGRVKLLKRVEIMEIEKVPSQRGRAVKTTSTSVPGFFAFRDKNGRRIFTNKPEEYDPEFFRPVVVPLEKATFFKTRAGRSVRLRSVEHPAVRGYQQGDADVERLVSFHANRNGLPESLVKAVIQAESGGNPRAESHCGARGLMQLMPATAAEMGIYNLFDPDENIAGGTQYLSQMIKMFNGNTELALAAYNAGPGAVKKYRGVPPYDETKTYVKRVLRYEQNYKKGERIQIASATETPARPAGPSRTGKDDFSITMTNGLIIRGTSYVVKDNGIQLKTSRKWEFVRNEDIRKTNFT